MTPDLKELTRRLRETPPHVLKEREAAAAIDSLIAELEQAKKDAARYRWFADIAVGGSFEKAEDAFAVFADAESCSYQELDAAISKALADVAAQGISGAPAMGKVMAILKTELAGRADMSAISAQVKQRLMLCP